MVEFQTSTGLIVLFRKLKVKITPSSEDNGVTVVLGCHWQSGSVAWAGVFTSEFGLTLKHLLKAGNSLSALLCCFESNAVHVARNSKFNVSCYDFLTFELLQLLCRCKPENWAASSFTAGYAICPQCFGVSAQVKRLQTVPQFFDALQSSASSICIPDISA